mgnify:CR=1 FL=1
MVSVALTMLFPALGVVLTRLVTREGFQMCAWCTVLAIFLQLRDHPHRLHVCRGHRARGRERHD